VLALTRYQQMVKTEKAGLCTFSPLPASVLRASPGRRSQHVVLLLHPGELGFQVAYPSPEPAYVRQDARIRPADVSEQCLRHGRSLFRDHVGFGLISWRACRPAGWYRDGHPAFGRPRVVLADVQFKERPVAEPEPA
jgi:hypothetical protein